MQCLKIILCCFVAAFASTAWAQDDELFKIDPSQVKEPLLKDLSPLLLLLEDDGPTIETPTVTYVSDSALRNEMSAFDEKRADGFDIMTSEVMISTAMRINLRVALLPAWLDQYVPPEKQSALKPTPMSQGTKGTLKYRGFDKEGYVVVDETIEDVIFSRYYFKTVRSDYQYLEPTHNYNPDTQTVTVWRKQKINREASQKLEIQKAERRVEQKRVAEERARERARRTVEEHRSQTDRYSRASQQELNSVFFGDRNAGQGFSTFGSGNNDLIKICTHCNGRGNFSKDVVTQQCTVSTDNSDDGWVRVNRVCRDVEGVDFGPRCKVCGGKGYIE